MNKNLTNRELEILNLIAKKNISFEIAKKLNISHNTVNVHRKNILKKLNLKSTSDLVRYSIENGLV